MLLRAYDEVRRAPDPAAAVEMALIRLCYAAELPGPEEALKALRDGGDLGAPSPAPTPPHGGGTAARGGAATRLAAQPAIAPAPAEPALRNFDDVVALIDKRRDIALRLDVQRYVRLISYRTGAISFEPAPGAPNTLAQRLAARLKEWTGQPWLVAAEGGGGAETLEEQQARSDAAVRAELLADPFVRQVMEVFPGAEVAEIRQLSVEEAAPAPMEDEADAEGEESP